MIETGRPIVISGANSNFGAAALHAFAAYGDRVWGAMGDTERRYDAKSAELGASSPPISVVEMDVTSGAGMRCQSRCSPTPY